MTLIEKILNIAVRHARNRRIFNELAAISDAELADLDISWAHIVEASRNASRRI